MSAFRLIAAEKTIIRSLRTARCLARSGFYAWERRAPSDQQLADLWLLEQIKEIHEADATRRHSTLGMLSPADYEQTTINNNSEKHQNN